MEKVYWYLLYTQQENAVFVIVVELHSRRQCHKCYGKNQAKTDCGSYTKMILKLLWVTFYMYIMTERVFLLTFRDINYFNIVIWIDVMEKSKWNRSKVNIKWRQIWVQLYHVHCTMHRSLFWGHLPISTGSI